MAASVLPVSLVIATRDRPSLLVDTLRSVLDGDARPAEIIVADQSTGERPCLNELAGGTGLVIRHLHLHTRGPSRARNAAIRASSHDVVVMTDDDVLVERDWLDRLVNALRRLPERTLVTGLVLPERVGDTRWFTPSVSSRDDRGRCGIAVIRIVEGRVAADPLFPQNLAVPRQAFRDVGLFDERLGPGTSFPAAEDNDFGRRLLEAGYRVAVTGEAVVVHRTWRPRADIVPLGWAYGVGQGAFFAKHLAAAPAYVLGRLGGEVGWRARRSARVSLQPPRQPRQVMADIAYVFGLVTGLVGWIARYGLSDGDGTPRLDEPAA